MRSFLYFLLKFEAFYDKMFDENDFVGFQDEEEFPDLSSSGTNKMLTGSNAAKLCNEVNNTSHYYDLPG